MIMNFLLIRYLILEYEDLISNKSFVSFDDDFD